MSAFDAWWAERFGATPPLGHRLRQVFRARWLRVHSLPGAKRYAESADEHEEVRRRAWACASEVLPTGGPLWIVTGEVEGSTHAEAATWPHEGFDALIDAIASDERRALWVSATSAEIFAPYDGGIDLILASEERRDALGRILSAWRSTHPEGL